MSLTPRHECGICDGVLQFRGLREGHPVWRCLQCHEWHTSEDCCDNPFVEPGDLISLREMPNDPDPIPVGTVGTVVSVPFDMDHSCPDPFDQIEVEWDNGRSLFLVPLVDRYEKVASAYEIQELEIA